MLIACLVADKCRKRIAKWNIRFITYISSHVKPEEIASLNFSSNTVYIMFKFYLAAVRIRGRKGEDKFGTSNPYYLGVGKDKTCKKLGLMKLI